MTNIDPHDSRLEVRQQTYRNQAEEAEAVKTADKRVFAKVRQFEDRLIAQAEQATNDGRAVIQNAFDLESAFREELIAPLSTGDLALTPPVAADYERERFQIEQEVTRLEELARRAEWQAERLDDPYGTWTERVRKFPPLRQHW